MVSSLPRDRLLFIPLTIRLFACLFLFDFMAALIHDEKHAALRSAIAALAAFIVSTIIALQCDAYKRLNHQTSYTSIFTAILRSATVAGRSHVMYALDTALLEGFYYEQFSLISVAGVEQYQLADEDAEDLAHNILLASLQQQTRIDDPASWFAAALKHAVARRNGG